MKALFPSKESELSSIELQNANFLNFGFAGNNLTSAINGRNFILPSTPYQTYPGRYKCDQENNKQVCDKACPVENITTNCPPCIHSIEIAKNKKFDKGKEPETVTMVLSSLGSEGKILDDFSHPIHLHGHSFYIVHVEHGTYTNGRFHENSKDIKCKDFNCSWTNSTVPDFLPSSGRINNTAIRKDTVIVPAGGYVVIAFQADNPGYWFMHCHMEAHLLEGMAIIVQEYPDDEQLKPPYGINNIGDFLWPQEPEAPKNWWRIRCIIASVIAAVLLIITMVLILVIIILLWCICRKPCQRKKKENQKSSDNVPNKFETKYEADKETYPLV
ncbi:MAG: multicopper oxidase domain-containing protein [Proteobacteria bacterium]|nr:multicopper oxidase domain-containing protein [Pseudomonadota bacterium]